MKKIEYAELLWHLYLLHCEVNGNCAECLAKYPCGTRDLIVKGWQIGRP